MSDEMYLHDNNVLSHLTRSQRACAFFRERCRIPSEILHEARSHPDISALRQVEYPTTSGVLRHLAVVMATVDTNDTTLVDLYANKGAADPLIIACALDAMEATADQLLPPAWVVVSNDKAVRAKAKELGVLSCTREEFLMRAEGKWET